MKKQLLCVFCILCFASLLYAQDEAPTYGWQKEATAALNLTQSTFDNYAQGGENSTAWQFRLGLKFVNDREKFNWANTGKLEYGQTKSGKDEYKKSVDEMKIESVFAFKLWKTINPFVSFTGETQFAAGYDYEQTPKAEISNFLDPGYFREAVGFAYRPNDIIQARLGAAMKQTVTNNFTKYSDDPETTEKEKLKNEFGAEGIIDFNYKISENSLIKSKVELFSNLQAFDEIDVIWDTDLTAKITKFIAFNFNVKLLYDKDISTKRQLKQVMGLGISYSLF
ncbi:DUF3078 domain-containing protein [candidate division KSB1 bacterium]|nr:DUF3078 domain-containing protein [candidate division KSB1 bacterium]